MYNYTIVVGGGGVLATTPHIQLQGEPSNRQQHTTTHKNAQQRDNLRGQKSLGPLKMSLEMAHKVILPPKKNYIQKVS